MLRIVKRALQEAPDVPSERWLLNVIVETQLPTIAILLLIEGQFLGPYQALVAPAVLLYFLFIILSTLRLSPALSLLTGLMSTLGYLAVTLYTQMRYPSAGAEVGAFPAAVYFIYAGLILAGGGVAAMVAAEIRVHVSAALREAELQHQLDRVNQSRARFSRGSSPATRPAWAASRWPAGINPPNRPAATTSIGRRSRTGGSRSAWAMRPVTGSARRS
jgi:hypothetical protein